MIVNRFSRRGERRFGPVRQGRLRFVFPSSGFQSLHEGIKDRDVRERLLKGRLAAHVLGDEDRENCICHDRYDTGLLQPGCHGHHVSSSGPWGINVSPRNGQGISCGVPKPKTSSPYRRSAAPSARVRCREHERRPSPRLLMTCLRGEGQPDYVAVAGNISPGHYQDSRPTGGPGSTSP